MIVEHVLPQVDCGRYPVKAIAGDEIEVSADIFRDGSWLLQAVIRYRGPAGKWQEAPMEHVDNDRWAGTFRPGEVGLFAYTIEAWTDHFATWRRDLVKRLDAKQEVSLELEEGALLIEARLKAVPAPDRKVLKDAVEAIRAGSGEVRDENDARAAAALDEEVARIMHRHSDRSGSTTYKPTLEMLVERERARFGAWYELFPRSTGTKTKHGTLATAAKTLARVADMGFDVVYLPPIHPIGTAHRKGKNNSLTPTAKDVGSPWAIGSPDGGHRDVHPDLGTLADFDAFVAAAERLGLEVALDFAIQCSPDHPWVTEHPDWFNHLPDGSIRYAENPPKKYQDIYPINFDTPDREGLWTELKSVLDHWIDHGVKIFRVDNPHTKALPFWEWVINAVHDEHPEVIFLAEAFTRPKVMQSLAKAGFTQSYTYFTWRNTKAELTEYLTELTQTEMAYYFRPNFFANTPDILHEYLQEGGPPAFKIRLVLAALLSPTYGIYSGYELFENVPMTEGSEEYLNSEKYELRPRDFSTSASLAPYIARINDIRRKNPALSELTNLTFHSVDKENLIAFSKSSPGQDSLLAVVNLNPFHWEEGTVHLDMEALGLDPWQSFEVHDLVTDSAYWWNGAANYVRLDPKDEPAHVFQVRG
ncbi:MAG: alpha-1,4-glucan--maltose-1-phosphate maltosyltransferase [Actinomycetota bacterium]|nr:alpha-1,4-glucan--maltose-1-phosphate maltosyltransferase [Actinomycetota bacterium]